MEHNLTEGVLCYLCMIMIVQYTECDQIYNDYLGITPNYFNL